MSYIDEHKRRVDETFIRRAIEIARTAAPESGAAPIGCVIVRDGDIIGEACNQVGSMSDPTAHAEIVAIRQAA